ncbi:hypothetical protein Tco_0906486 [Tanacetum coccineum]|uniref:Uncharacterized protein n=1 Tax=Tanacetum coccineum TaxID=301880 RepID=A0ABQ5CGM7_9ASTR
MKHWKSGFFLIDRQAILDSMVWRHPSAAIDDPRPAAGSFSMADVRRLSAHVIKLRDMPEGVLVLSRLSHVWKSRVCDLVLWGANENGMGVQEEPHHDIKPTLQRLPFYYTPPAAADTVISDPTPADLAAGTHSAKVLAKGEAFQKRKASTSGATSSHVAKCTRSALAQSSGSTTRPSLFVGDDDDDACVEILLVTPLRSAAVIPSSGNQGGSFATPTAEGSNPQDSRGKGIMADDAAAPSVGGIAGNCEFIREEWDAPYRHTFRVLAKEVFKDPAVCKTFVDYFPTPREMVQVESLYDNQLTPKMSVLHCMMMSHGRKLLARCHGLNQSHHYRLINVSSFLVSVLELQVSTLKKQVFRHNDKLSSFDSSFAKSKAKGKERKKKIKSLTKSLDNLHIEVAHLSADLNRATI